MHNPSPRQLKTRNSEAQDRHRKEVFWQITIPFIAILIVGGTLTGLAIGFGSAEDHSQYADVSMIWLLTSVIFSSLLFLIILAATTYGIIYLIGILPPFFKKVQDLFIQIQEIESRVEDTLAEPVVSLKVFFEAIHTLKKKLSG